MFFVYAPTPYVSSFFSLSSELYRRGLEVVSWYKISSPSFVISRSCPWIADTVTSTARFPFFLRRLTNDLNGVSEVIAASIKSDS